MGYVILDTEYTTWPGALANGWSAPGQHREIVQIGAILVDESFVEITSFSRIVRPSINPYVSAYFQQLTAITQRTVDEEGISFSQALADLVKFCDSRPTIICMDGDSGVFRENSTINGVNFPFESDFHRLRPFLVDLGINLSGISSGDLHKLTKRPLEGHTHNALHDCRSMARWLEWEVHSGNSISVNGLPRDIPNDNARPPMPIK